MSELEKANSVAGLARSPAMPDAAAAGRMIRAAREASGLHIGALAVAMKVPVSKLEALEDGTLTALSGTVFSRALASSVCRALKVDSEEILQAMPRAPAAQLQQMGALNEPFRSAAGGSHTRLTEKLLKPSMLAVAALLTGVAVLFFLPEIRGFLPDDNGTPGQASDHAAGVPPTTKAAASSQEPLLSGPSATVDRSARVTESVTHGASSPVGAAKTMPAPANPLESSNAVMRSGTVLAGVAEGAGLLGFKASAPSWVEVTDAKGALVLRKTLSSGEVVQVGGTPPLKVVVGRADAIEVTVRGKRILLQEWSKDNVARFEVK
jgi:cytoskeleton protein RodZ